MGEAEVSAFLSHLARHERLAASTQNQALSSLLFLYRHMLRRRCRGSMTSSGRDGRYAFRPFSPVRRYRQCSPRCEELTV